MRRFPGSYLLSRLAHALLLLIGVSTLSFALLELAPGDYLDEAKLNPQIGPETLAALREQYGLNQSVSQKYVHWLKSVAEGDLGISFAYNLPVSALLWPRARRTLEITVTALALSWLIAIPLGICSAAGRGGWLDRCLGWAVSALLAIPDLVLACVVLLIAVRSGAFQASHPVLPITVLVLGALPLLLRHVRSSLLGVVDEPYVRAARAHGISGVRLWFKYLLPAAANPLISLFGLSIGGLISSSLLIEVVLGWPGLGPLFLEAISARDLYLVIGSLMLSAVFLIAGALLADLMLYAVDPRIQSGS